MSLLAPPAPPEPDLPVSVRTAPPADPAPFKVGTLAYTKSGLIVMFLWLLWGDFCFIIMETVVPTILPVKLNALGASNSMVGLIVTTIPGVMNMAVNPVVSFRSDRHRGRWGRRIPFLVGATPFLVLFLILLGYSESIGDGLHRLLGAGEGARLAVVLTVLGGFMVCFQFFNMFVASVYYYLFNDVVPREFLARFMALFRMVGAAAGALFNIFVFKYASTHMAEIFLGAGLLYFFAFMFMCWKVKEGAYPPPPPNDGGGVGVLAAVNTYRKECFGHPFYWYFYLANTCVAITWTTGAYAFFMGRSFGLDADAYGKFAGALGIASTLLLYPAGMLADRFHPLRVLIAASIAIVVMQPLWFLTFLTDFTPAGERSLYFVISSVGTVTAVLYAAAELPMFMRLLPADRYGQYSSANSIIRSLGVMFSGVACGAFIDLVRTRFPAEDFCYRFLPVWTGFFYALSLVFLLLLRRECQRSGWDNHQRVRAPRPG